jgi:hypothetical protein
MGQCAGSGVTRAYRAASLPTLLAK